MASLGWGLSAAVAHPHPLWSLLRPFAVTNDAGQPLLQPFPGWADQDPQLGRTKLIYVQSMEIDSRGIMWILDVGRVRGCHTRTQTQSQPLTPTSLGWDPESVGCKCTNVNELRLGFSNTKCKCK